MAPVNAADARYNNPKVKQVALDYCKTWGGQCGLPAATAYCQSKGYKVAGRFGLRRDSPPTRVIGTGQTCKDPGCDRIAWVQCKGPKTYRNPKIGKVALDLCKTWGKDCGMPAATAYCKRRGHIRAAKFRVRQDSPPTRVINGEQVCKASNCDRISSVGCVGWKKSYLKKKKSKKKPASKSPGADCGKCDAGGDVQIPKDLSPDTETYEDEDGFLIFEDDS